MVNELGSLRERTFDAVIFDMDETLISSGPATRKAWLRWADEHDIPASVLDGLQGIPSRQIVDELIPADQADRAAERIEEIELTTIEGIHPLPGAERAFAELASAKVAIATSCTNALFEVRFKESGLAHPGVAVTCQMVKRGKPAPDIFLEAANRLGVDPTRTLVVEDAPAGVRGAREAGCAVLAVMTTATPDQLDADAIVKNLDALTWHVDEHGKVTVRVRD